MFDIEPTREPDRTPRTPSTFRAPLSSPPPAPRSWWGTLPGQAAILAIIGGVIVIVLGLTGVIGPLSMR